jgi:hypothetical protein
MKTIELRVVRWRYNNFYFSISLSGNSKSPVRSHLILWTNKGTMHPISLEYWTFHDQKLYSCEISSETPSHENY